MASIVLDPVVGSALSKLGSLVEEEACMVLGVGAEIKKLMRRLERLKIYLADAESKGIQDPSIRSWLGELKDVMYDADDIIDRCRIEGSKLLEEVGCFNFVSHCFPSFSCFTSTLLRREIARQIKELNDTLKEIEDNKPTGLEIRIVGPVHKPRSDPILSDSDVVGRDIEEATRDLVESIIEESDQRRKCVVYGITGMGGIGKTTLASKVYNHTSIASTFPIRIWVCVSQDFSETDLLKELIRGTGGVCGEASSKAELKTMLVSSLRSDFFIVLDDIWRASVWEDLLKTPLETCRAVRGRVLVTTRDVAVLRNMHASIHDVEKMNNQDGWELLCKKVFGYDGEEEEMLALKDIGIRIVDKCAGLPLAIKSIAGVLRNKETSRREWERLLRSNAWSMANLPEELMGALYLSYDDLPSHLKQCFLYCSLFPEDFSIYRNSLTKLWVAEGFIREEDKNTNVILEETAEEYCEELVQRSLLHIDSRYLNSTHYKMHDLHRSLAQYLVGDESICISGNAIGTVTNTLRKLRRLSFSNQDGSTTVLPDAIREKSQCLRTLIFFNSSHLSMLLEDVMSLGSLRVLDLSGTKIERLPDSTGKLVHLRYLKLENTNLCQLPNLIGNLVNLEVLNLRGCGDLETLPQGITRLYNLRCLDISGTRISHMPKGLGQLKQLNELVGFTVGNNDICSRLGFEVCMIEELDGLSELRALSILRLENIDSSCDIITLRSKPFLKQLILVFSNIDFSADEMAEIQNRMVKVVEALCPPPTLETFFIVNYLGRAYPSWIMSLRASFPHLHEVYLRNCRLCTHLPPMGQLPQLSLFRIKGADAIVNIGPELLFDKCHASVRIGFPKLKSLKFKRMPNWEEWSFGTASNSVLPCLELLILEDCPKLKFLPAGLSATGLQELFIYGAHSLLEIKNLPHLATVLFVEDCLSLESICHLPLLCNMAIVKCPRLINVMNVDALSYLRLDCTEAEEGSMDELVVPYKEERLPDWLQGLATLQEQQWQRREGDTSIYLPKKFVFELRCGPILLRRCRKGGEDWPIIKQFSEVHITALNGAESMFYSRTTGTYKEVIEDRDLPSSSAEEKV